MRVFFLLLFNLSLCQLIYGAEESSSFPLQGKKGNVIVHNRVVARVNDKPITLLDVVKKMNLIFTQHYSAYVHIPSARYQFYSQNWQSFLEEMIDQELIVADSKNKLIPVSRGDIRQEMNTKFGPDVIKNLEDMGWTYDEGWKYVEREILMQRAIGYNVEHKSSFKVTPKKIQNAYEDYLRENPPHKSYDYQVVSFQSDDLEKSQQVARIAFLLLTDQNLPLESLESSLESGGHLKETSLKISDPFKRKETEISQAHQQVIQTLSPGKTSSPTVQQVGDKTFVRIFILNDLSEVSPQSFNLMEKELRAKLKNQIIEQTSDEYLEGLRNQHLIVRESIQNPSELFLLQ